MKTARRYWEAILCGVISSAVFWGIQHFGWTTPIKTFALAWWWIWVGLLLGLLYLLGKRVIEVYTKLGHLLKIGPFQLKWGILWDKEANPFCPSCKTPLTGGGYGNMLYCIKCDKNISIREGASVLLRDEAQKFLRGEQKKGASQPGD